MKKLSTIAIATLLTSTLFAEDVKPMPQDGTKPQTNKETKEGLYGHVVVHHIFGGLDNSYDPNYGSAYGAEIGYAANNVVIDGLSAKVSIEVNGDTGLTDLTENTKIASGLFMGDATDSATLRNTYLNIADALVTYKIQNTCVKAGQSTLKSPMTVESTSTIPNRYRYALVKNKDIQDTTLSAGYIAQMAYGSRALTGLSLGFNDIAGGTTSIVKKNRGEYFSMGAIAEGSSTSTNDAGVVVVSVTNKSIPMTTIEAWNYFASELSNTFYGESITKIALDKSINLIAALQGIQQISLVENDNSIGYIAGAKIGVQGYGAKFCAAYDKTDATGITSRWGGDPIWTSSIFSRGGYAGNVDAYKLTASYTLKDIIPGDLTLMASLANYSSSATSTTSVDSETDMAIVYKPMKKVMVKLFNATRSTITDSTTTEKQNHTRLIAKYSF